MLHLIKPVIENASMKILKHGIVPKHVVLVADGARRFGKKNRISVQENHEIGLHGVMLEFIDWCLELGIPEYSILMYSFGNYYRPADEVKHWIAVLKIWLMKCIVSWKVLQKKGIRFNFYGKLKLIPSEINALMGILNLITKNNTKIVVNMAMGYTGKHEMSSVAFHLHKAVAQGFLKIEDLTVDLFNECLFAIENREGDLLIRTSGHKRISDFLSWQVANGIFYFSDALWPEFSKINFMKAILYYQINRKPRMTPSKTIFERHIMEFLNESKNEKRHMLLAYGVELRFFPDPEIKEILCYDYETLFEYFKLKYKLKIYPLCFILYDN